MTRINCDVLNCSHNKDYICYSNRVDIGGVAADTENGTCCGSFLNKSLYSDLTNNTNNSGPCDALICKVDTCVYNKNKLCNLHSIEVSGSKAQIYSETVCNSFQNGK